jgi:hypothetical protein
MKDGAKSQAAPGFENRHEAPSYPIRPTARAPENKKKDVTQNDATYAQRRLQKMT